MTTGDEERRRQPGRRVEHVVPQPRRPDSGRERRARRGRRRPPGLREDRLHRADRRDRPRQHDRRPAQQQARPRPPGLEQHGHLRRGHPGDHVGDQRHVGTADPGRTRWSTPSPTTTGGHARPNSMKCLRPGRTAHRRREWACRPDFPALRG
ncbi:hypothetical protein K7G98_11660 [Saccharothrix sp. MB29]|nr:hypothetical protein [Saccharothrix sp. MB29]